MTAEGLSFRRRVFVVMPFGQKLDLKNGVVVDFDQRGDQTGD